MITSVRKTIAGTKPDKKGRWWSYMICKIDDDNRPRYHVIRVDNCCDIMQRIGYALTYTHALNLVMQYDKNGRISPEDVR
jgi:hypothetical protein